MNKAFIREPDDFEPRCPGCGIQGQSVRRVTLEAQLPAEQVQRLSDPAHYCANPRCDIGYYDGMGADIKASLGRNSAFPKDSTAPVCSCFGLRVEDIEQAAAVGDTQQVKAWLARCESPQARCSHTAPGGQCCQGQIQRLFLKHFKASRDPGR